MYFDGCAGWCFRGDTPPKQQESDTTHHHHQPPPPPCHTDRNRSSTSFVRQWGGLSKYSRTESMWNADAQSKQCVQSTTLCLIWTSSLTQRVATQPTPPILSPLRASWRACTSGKLKGAVCAAKTSPPCPSLDRCSRPLRVVNQHAPPTPATLRRKQRSSGNRCDHVLVYHRPAQPLGPHSKQRLLQRVQAAAHPSLLHK